ncbi:MAG: hypothetical protein Q9162_003567 [Coniocarpon cinnabarinum]
MRGSRFSGATIAALSAASAVAQQPSWQTIPSLAIKGQHFFYSNNGSEFYMRGVAYQQGLSSNGTVGDSDNTQYIDPLSNADNCRRDVPYLTQLRTNVIRTYAIDPTQNHDDCMQMLADAGIYVVSDLSEPNQSINRDDPNWNVLLYQRYTSVIDSLSKYNNVLGFFAGNEVSNSPNTTAASAFVKAAVRDSKTYIRSQNYHPMGVGYATYDGPIRDQLAEYFNCGDPAEAIDFWGYNVYSWCGDSTFEESGYQERTRFFQDYSVPIFFAEYGCNQVEPRDFGDVPVLFGPRMEEIWSGGIVYEYFQEANEFGLVSVDGNNVSPLADFTHLSSRMASVSPSSTNSDSYNPTFSPTNCPSVVTSAAPSTADASEQQWLAPATPLPPSPNPELCSCEMSQLQCVSTSDNQDTYQDDFNYICGQVRGACAGINTNITTGSYGVYGMCSPQQQLSFAMNKYYQAQSGQAKSSACDFSGRASLRSTSSPTGTYQAHAWLMPVRMRQANNLRLGSCVSLLQAAGTNGAGNVPQPSGNSSQQSAAAGGSGGSGGSGSQGGSGSSSSAAANIIGIPSFDTGLLQMFGYVLVAFVSGAGMILL